MIVSAKGSVFALLRWQWRYAVLFAASGTAVAALEHFFAEPWLRLSTTPLVVVGAALGIFVSFRTNSAYDRWWEGRKLWGRLINSSRMFATQIVSYLPRSKGAEATDAQQRLVRRHIAYVHTLRVLLRKQELRKDEDVSKYLGDDLEQVARSSNPTHALLQKQLDEITKLSEDKQVDEFRLQSLDRTVAALLDIQGGCERIKKTPLPRGYGFIAERLILAYGLLFPLAIVKEMGWFAIPTNVLVCLSFALISEAGRVLEDPFTMFWNGLPLSNMSKTIEANLLERLGETDLPQVPGPDKKGILM